MWMQINMQTLQVQRCLDVTNAFAIKHVICEHLPKQAALSMLTLINMQTLQNTASS